MRALMIWLALLSGGAAAAQTEYTQYGDWWVLVERHDTGEDRRVYCRAMTGGDGWPSLEVGMSNGDAGPPEVYPLPMAVEHAVRGYDTVMQDGQTAAFIDDVGRRIAGSVSGGIDDEGFAWAQAEPDRADAQALLGMMRRGNVLEVEVAGAPFLTASLRGFTAAYGKIAEECGFSTAGVID